MSIIEILRRLFTFKKKDVKKERTQEHLYLIKEAELESEISKLLSEKENKLIDIFLDFYKNLEEKISEFERSLKELEGEKISLPDKQTEMLVNAKKKEFLEKMTSLLNEFKSKNLELGNFTSNLFFYQKSYEKLREINALSLKDFLTIKNYFRSSGKVLANFKALFVHFEDFHKKIYNDEVKKISEIKKQVSDYYWLKSELEKSYDNLKKEKEVLLKKEEELELKRKNLEMLENSEEFKRLRELEKEKAKIQYREKELSSICVEKAASIEHIIKKLRKRIGGKEEELLERFISSPFDSVITFNVQDFLSSLIERMKTLSFKDEEILKVKILIEDKVFEKISKEYFLLEERLKELENEMEKISVVKEKKKLEDEINSILFDLQEVKKSIEKIEKRIEELNFLKEKIKEELERCFSEFLEREVKIV